MGNLNELTELGLLIAAGVVAAFVAVRLGLPTILGYLIAGIALSLLIPHTAQSVFIQGIAQLGAVLLLFTIGIEFSLVTIKKYFRIVITGAILQAVLTIFLASLILPSMGFSDYEAFFIGTLVSMSSTAFVMKMLEVRGQTHTQAGNIMLGWLVTQDVLIIVWYLLLAAFAPNATAQADLFITIVKAAAIIGFTYFLAKYLLPPLLAQVAKGRSDELLLISALGTVLIFAVFTNLMGISFTIGAFLAGLALSESFLNHEIFTEVKPLRNLFLMIFFVSIGSLFDVNLFLQNITPILVILLVILPLKVLMIVVINVWFKVHIRNAIRVGLGISQIGEFAFLGAQLGLASGWINQSIYSIIVGSTVLSMAATPILYANVEALYGFLDRRMLMLTPNLHRGLFVNSTAVENEVFGSKYEDHIILCGFGRVGDYVAQALILSQIPFVGIELSAEQAQAKSAQLKVPVIFGDAGSGDILTQAGIADAKVLVVTLPESSDSAALIKKARELNPKIKIVARAHQPEEITDADHLVQPEFEAALGIIVILYKLIQRRHKRALDVLRTTQQDGLNLT